MSEQENNMDIHQVVDEIYDAGIQYADAYSIYQRYKEGFKHALSTIKQRVRQNDPPNGKKSWTKDDLEEFAYADEEFKEYLDNWEVAVKEMNLARNEQDSWKNRFEAMRTQMANERAIKV
jgi:hypothetical protein